MRRTKYAILLLILSLVLTGCGIFTPSEQELQDSIPTLSLTAGRYRYQIPTGGYSWAGYKPLGGGGPRRTPWPSSTPSATGSPTPRSR